MSYSPNCTTWCVHTDEHLAPSECLDREEYRDFLDQRRRWWDAERDLIDRTNKAETKALCCQCGRVRMTKHGAKGIAGNRFSGPRDDDWGGPHRMVSRVCATCKAETPHAYLADVDDPRRNRIEMFDRGCSTEEVDAESMRLADLVIRRDQNQDH